MSILSAVKDFILTYPSLETGRPVTVDFAGEEPVWYSILPVSGNPNLQTYVNGTKIKQFPFAFQTVDYTMDELERLDNIAFFEGFSEWLQAQTDNGILPTMDAGKTPTAIEATTWMYLFQDGQSGTGVYQIMCRLIYEQQP